MKRKERNFNNIMRDAIATLQDPEACQRNLEQNIKSHKPEKVTVVDEQGNATTLDLIWVVRAYERPKNDQSLLRQKLKNWWLDKIERILRNQ